MIAFLYSSTKLASLTFDVDAENQVIFHPVDLQPPVPVRATVSGTTLKNRSFKHVLARKLKFRVVISSDELSDMPELISENLQFLLNFWNSNYKYISYKNEDAYTDYIEVMWDTDEFPISYIENLIYLPEAAIELISLAPVSEEIISAIGLKPVSADYY